MPGIQEELDKHVNIMPGIQEELDTTCKQNAWNTRGTGYNM